MSIHIDKDFIRAIQIRAIKAVEKPNYEDFIRGIAKWYSKTYFTSLQVVLTEMSEVELLQTYYEDQFKQLADNAKENEQLKESFDKIKRRIFDKTGTEDKAEIESEVEDDMWAEAIKQEIQKDAKTKQDKEPQQPNIKEEPPTQVDTHQFDIPDFISREGEDAFNDFGDDE